MSWIVRDKVTKKAVAEFYCEETLQAVNTSKYEVIPARQYLEELNAAVRQARNLGGRGGAEKCRYDLGAHNV